MEDSGFIARLQQGIAEGEKVIAKIDKAHEEEKERLREERKAKKKAAVIARQQEETAVKEKEEAEARVRAEAEAKARAEAEQEEREVAAATGGDGGMVVEGGEEEVAVGQERTAVDSRGDEGRAQTASGLGILTIPALRKAGKGMVVELSKRRVGGAKKPLRTMQAHSGPLPELRDVPCHRCEVLGKPCYVKTAHVCARCKASKVRCEAGSGVEKKQKRKRVRSPSIEEETLGEGSSARPLQRSRETYIISSEEEKEKDEVVVVYERMARSVRRRAEEKAKEYEALAAAFAKYDQ